jgi:hypothetical protein
MRTMILLAVAVAGTAVALVIFPGFRTKVESVLFSASADEGATADAKPLSGSAKVAQEAARSLWDKASRAVTGTEEEQPSAATPDSPGKPSGPPPGAPAQGAADSPIAAPDALRAP